MTLLTIAKAVADEVGVARPSSVISNPQPHVQKILRACDKVGTQLMKKVAWQILQKEQTFTSVATEVQTGILPSDFDRIVPETFWNRTDYLLISEAQTPVEWQGLKASNYAGQPKYRLRGGYLYILPTMSAGKSLAFEYVSENWCASSGGTGQSAWAADTDVGVLDEELLTRAATLVYLTTELLPFGPAEQSFNEYFGMLLENDQPDAGVMVAADIFGTATRHFSGTPTIAGSSNINTL
jgi:hypothetical protein